MRATDLNHAYQETGRLADRLHALKAMCQRQASLADDDAQGWGDLERQKQERYDELAAMDLPAQFLRWRALADAAPDDDAETAASRRRLAESAEANIELLQEIAACEAEAERRMARGLDGLKQEATARRQVGDLQRAYAAPPPRQPRFLDKRE